MFKIKRYSAMITTTKFGTVLHGAGFTKRGAKRNAERLARLMAVNEFAGSKLQQIELFRVERKYDRLTNANRVEVINY